MGFLQVDLKDTFTDALRKKIANAGPKVANSLAHEIVRDTEPFVPAMTKSLANRTQVVENRIIYPGPYARYLYYRKVMVDSVTGKGPMRIVGKDGQTEAIRFRKGARLTPTERPLKISKAVHPQAQDHWFEASKAQNLDKWIEVAKRLVKDEL